MHCIIAHASHAQWPLAAYEGLQLPRLHALLQALQPGRTAREGTDDDPALMAMPHERALAQALGWALDGPLPWAAWHSRLQHPPHTDGALAAQAAQAWLTPCHWQVGMNRVVMHPPERLALGDAESEALMQAMHALLAPVGLALHWQGDALSWRVCGAALAGWALPSVDRVLTGQAGEGPGAEGDVRPWLSQAWPRQWAAWHSELQMLAYTHPVNEARLARGAPVVNAFWLHGAGALPALLPSAAPTAAAAHAAAPATATEQPQVLTALQTPTRLRDVQAWRQAWQALDAQLPAAHTPGLRLSLCSDSAVQHWQAHPPGVWGHLQRAGRNAWRPTQTDTVLKALATP